MTVERTLSEQEMIDILEDIARTGRNAAAKIAAIKELRAMGRGEKSSEASVAELYDVANPGRARKAG
jgi:hypothetical protein